jgi:RNA polymerase sigma-70 factor (ECF subfamily)
MIRIGSAREDDEGPALDLEGGGPDAERTVLDAESRERLKRLVKGLPRSHRDALLLVATQDLPYAEAAALLGIPVGTLKWRVSDARRMLRERMGR